MSRHMLCGLAAMSVLAACLSFTAMSRAEEAPEIRGVELMCVGALGGGYPDRGGLLMTARLRRLPETPLALEAGFYAPWGIGVNLLVDVFRNDRLRVHLIDPGVFYAWEPELRVSRPDVERNFDITLGVGVEWRFAGRWWLTIDSRFYFANPIRVIGYYGDFARRIYSDAAQGVQTWIGVGYTF